MRKSLSWDIYTDKPNLLSLCLGGFHLPISIAVSIYFSAHSVPSCLSNSWASYFWAEFCRWSMFHQELQYSLSNLIVAGSIYCIEQFMLVFDCFVPLGTFLYVFYWRAFFFLSTSCIHCLNVAVDHLCYFYHSFQLKEQLFTYSTKIYSCYYGWIIKMGSTFLSAWIWLQDFATFLLVGQDSREASWLIALYTFSSPAETLK